MEKLRATLDTVLHWPPIGDLFVMTPKYSSELLLSEVVLDSVRFARALCSHKCIWLDFSYTKTSMLCHAVMPGDPGCPVVSGLCSEILIAWQSASSVCLLCKNLGISEVSNRAGTRTALEGAD